MVVGGGALAAILIADLIERRQNALAVLRGFTENLRHEIKRRVGEARQIRVTVNLENFAQQKIIFAQRRSVDRHRSPPSAY